jgi:ABC-2 type transport system permease protein
MIEQLRVNARVVGALGMRSIKQTFRRPQLMAPILIFPTLLLAVQVGGAGRAVDLPLFPDVNGFLDFMLAGAMIQSCLLAGNSGGIAFAVDIEMGFTDRLLAAPISRFAMVLGRLAGTAAMGALTAVWFIAIGLIFGAEIEAGWPGVLLAIALVTLTATAVGSIAAAIALRAGTASVVQGLFPLVFVILFLSTAFFPEALLLEPAQTIAGWNPFSFIVNAIRDPVAFGISGTDLLEGIVAIAGIMALGLGLSALALRYRLRVG